MPTDGIATALVDRLIRTDRPRELLALGLTEVLTDLHAPAGLLWLLDDTHGVLEWVAYGLPARHSQRLGQQLAARLPFMPHPPDMTDLPPAHPARGDLPLAGPLLYVPLGAGKERLGGALLTAALPEEDHRRQISALLTLCARLALGLLRQRELTQLRVLQERIRLTRGLHDSLARGLQGLVLGTRTAETTLKGDPTRALPLLARMQHLLTSFEAQVQALFFHLRPELVQEQGLVRALELVAENVRQQQGVHVETSLAPLALPPDLQELLFAVALEALHNAQRHANCRQIQITLAGESGWVALTVADDGLGFDPRRTGTGQGLQVIRDACRRAGGQVLMETGPLVGTHLRAELPWHDEA